LRGSCCEDVIMPVAIELSRIITKDLDAEQVIYLKEVGGTRGFPC